MPNWLKFQKIVSNMIQTDLGGESCTIQIPGEITYDYEMGEQESAPIIDEFSVALIPTNKDDLKDLPEGLRERATRKIFSVKPIPKNATIISNFDKYQYEIIVPSVAYTAGGLVHCYRTYVGKIENMTAEE